MKRAAPLEFLFERFRESPERPAFVDRGVTTTYRDLLTTVAEAEAWLEASGVGRGEVVIVVGDYSPSAVALLLALARRGCVLVPITPASVVEREVVLSLSEAAWVIEQPERPELARPEATGRRATHPLLRRLLDSGRPGLLLFSSGSTGTPKAVLHDLARVAAKYERRPPPIVAIAFLMLDHFGGVNTILNVTAGLGTVVTLASRTVEGVCQVIQDQRVEILPATPSFLNLLVRSDAPRRYDLRSLQRITYGTEPMSQVTLDRLRAAFPGVALQQTYGLSELGVLRSRSRDDGSLFMRLGGEGFEVRVREGILWVRSAYAMEGYLNAPSPFTADGWFDTQDKVEVDGEWLRVMGRASDLINVAGQKVYPAEVEDVILGLGGVVEAVVHGEANALLGQVVVARVATERTEPLAELRARVRAACAARLAPFKVPQKVLPASAADLTSGRMKKRRGPAP